MSPDLDVRVREDGSRYVTSQIRTGFRLVVHADEDLEAEVAAAETIYLDCIQRAATMKDNAS